MVSSPQVGQIIRLRLWHGVVLDVFTNETGKTILRVQTVRNVFRRLNPEFIEFDLAPDAIEPASLDDLETEVASYQAVLQQSLHELVSHPRNDVPSTNNSAWPFLPAMLISP